LITCGAWPGRKCSTCSRISVSSAGEFIAPRGTSNGARCVVAARCARSAWAAATPSA
jgi:hypothetical protein